MSDVDKGGYISVEDMRNKLAEISGTSVDNVEEINGNYYVCIRAGIRNAITRKVLVYQA